MVVIDGCYFLSKYSICVEDDKPFKLPLKIPSEAGDGNGMCMNAFTNMYPSAATVYIDSTRIGVWPPNQYATRDAGNYNVKWYMWTYYPFRNMAAHILVDYTHDLAWYKVHF